MAAAARTSRNAGREEGPQWARRFPDTREGMDAMMTHREARQLPDDTDPDTIDDPDVRDAFLERLQSNEDDDTNTDNGTDGHRNGRGRAAAADPRRRGRGRTTRSYAPTLTPPTRLTTADGTGFALGLLLYALGINALRYGWPGVTGWISAKFINKPPDPPLTTSTAPPAAGGRGKFDFGRGSFGGNW